MRTIALLLISFCIHLHVIHAQQLQDPEKAIDEMIENATKYLTIPDSIHRYAVWVDSLSKRYHYLKGEAAGAKLRGISAIYKGEIEDALTHYRQSLQLYKQLGDSLEVGKAFYNIAMSYNMKADFNHTINHALEAIRIFDAINDYNGTGRVYNLMGIAASRHKEYEKASNYFKQFLRYAKLAKDSKEIATAYNNLGSTYTFLEHTDSALYYLQQSVNLHLDLGQDRGLESTYENMATLLEKQGQIDEAIANLQKALTISIRDGHAVREASGSYNLGRIYRQTHDDQQARKYMLRSLELARQLGDPYQLSKSLEQMAYISMDLSQPEQAYAYLLESNTYRDSIFSTELARTNEELIKIYETEKKEQENLALSQEIYIKSLQLRQRNTWLIIAGVFMVLLALGAWLRIRNRQLVANARLQKELALQQEEATWGIIQAEERERGRIAADLHDGVGQLISASLLNLKQIHKTIRNGVFPEPLQMENTLSLLENSYDEMRMISHQMMPNTLLKAGLIQSLREFLNKVDQHHLKISLDITGLQERLDEQTEITLYRCIQECVNNVIKHAEATKLSIQLVKDKDGISVSIEDNGRGFDTNKESHFPGIGLKNIRARVALLKGQLDIDSKPAKGTLIVIHLPIYSRHEE